MTSVSIDDPNDEVFNDSSSSSENDEPKDISDIIDNIGKIQQLKESIATSIPIAIKEAEKNKEEEEQKARKQEELDKCKIEFFFKHSNDLTKFKPEFLCRIYDYCHRIWHKINDDEVKIFKRVIYHCLNSPKYSQVIKEIVFNDDGTTNLLITDFKRIFKITVSEKTYNLKHDGTNYYLS